MSQLQSHTLRSHAECIHYLSSDPRNILIFGKYVLTPLPNLGHLCISHLALAHSFEWGALSFEFIQYGTLRYVHKYESRDEALEHWSKSRRGVDPGCM